MDTSLKAGWCCYCLYIPAVYISSQYEPYAMKTFAKPVCRGCLIYIFLWRVLFCLRSGLMLIKLQSQNKSKFNIDIWTYCRRLKYHFIQQRLQLLLRCARISLTEHSAANKSSSDKLTDTTVKWIASDCKIISIFVWKKHLVITCQREDD